MKQNHTLRALISGLLLLAAGTSDAALILNENFNNYFGGNQDAQQFNTGLNVSFGGNLPDFNKNGLSAIHAVDLDGVGNYAAMFFKDNVITLMSPIAANTSGTSYSVAFDAGPAVYADASQTTTAADGLIISILRGDNTVLNSFTYMPGAWAGAETLTPVSFNYTGDGTGVVSLRVESLLANDDRFGGAIDNLTINSIPEPNSVALVGSSVVLLGGLAAVRRRRATGA